MSKREDKNPWFYPYEPDESAAYRLFCFPYAGGGASIFRTWQSGLGQKINICPVQLPGRENRIGEAPFTNLLEVVDSVEKALTPYLGLPFAFFGHSMGAKIAFELSRKLSQKKGIEPSYLFISGCLVPHIPEPNPICRLPKDAFIHELYRYSGTPEAVLMNAELMDFFMPLLRADFTLVETYECPKQDGKLMCPICVLGGEDDREASVEKLEAWRTYTSGCFDLRLFPGNHFFIISAQSLVLKTISTMLL
ncbi:MAG: thioesterase [Proteobacteria bacterium]|nr:thioesterase [Pseudomonadota bacterium]